MARHYLFVSDFDQTLSFDDSGVALSALLGIDGFEEKVAGLSRLNLVQQGAELAYLLRHDPELRRIRRADLVEAGRRVTLKHNVALLARLLAEGVPGFDLDFYVLSAAPEEIVHSALHGLLPPERIIGTRFEYEAETGEIRGIVRGTAGYGKVAALEELRGRLGVPLDRVVYVGDGSSDIHVMLHVNSGDGFTIAASESRIIAQIARRTIISDDALSVLVPVLEEIAGYPPGRIRELFERAGLVIQEWGKVRTDWLTIRDASDLVTHSPASEASGLPKRLM
jgi:phosphoserine phosphatase